MTQEQLVLLGGAILSLLMMYVPPLKSWYDKLESGYKQLFMLGILTVVVAGSFGLSCAGILESYVCSVAGAVDAVSLLVLAIMANQGVYKITSYLEPAERQ